MILSEKLLQHIWRYRLYNVRELRTMAGETLKIIHPGTFNTDAGPDFLHARIQVGDTLLAGHVEIHLKASDWQRHRHQEDPSYGNVVLHVVFKADEEMEDLKLQGIPTLELQERVSNYLLSRYEQLMNETAFVPCAGQLRLTDELTWLNWKDRLIIERLEQKTTMFRHWLQESRGDWEEIFYRAIARSYGVAVNSDAFEQLSRSLPMRILAKHKSALPQLEALLFGQAGLLQDNFSDAYPQMLRDEYRFLKKKYQLVPLDAFRWKWLRMRPSAFPSVRIAQFAALVYRSSHLFSRVLEAGTVQRVYQMLEVSASEYWHTHYRFDQSSVMKPKKMGKDAIQRIIINTIVPVLFFYGKEKSLPAFCERALVFLKSLPPERNRITGEWKQLGITHQNALDSQSLLHLKKHYCDEKFCLDCSVGNKIMRAGES